MALKVVKSAAHYTETALDEIKLLKCVSSLIITESLLWKNWLWHLFKWTTGPWNWWRRSISRTMCPTLGRLQNQWCEWHPRMHGVWSPGTQFTQVYYQKQLPRDSSGKCQNHNEAGASRASLFAHQMSDYSHWHQTGKCLNLRRWGSHSQDRCRCHLFSQNGIKITWISRYNTKHVIKKHELHNNCYF